MNKYRCNWCYKTLYSGVLHNNSPCFDCNRGYMVVEDTSKMWPNKKVRVSDQYTNMQQILKDAPVQYPGPVVPRKVYLVGSLRNPAIREAAKVLRDAGMEVFDDWHGCGPEADDHWKTYEKDRGRTYIQALEGKLAGHAFNFDKSNLDEADTVVLILPAGKSGHLELGYAAGRGKDTFIVLEPDRDEDRWDLMYKFATRIVTNIHGVPLYYAE